VAVDVVGWGVLSPKFQVSVHPEGSGDAVNVTAALLPAPAHPDMETVVTLSNSGHWHGGTVKVTECGGQFSG
jgi:hypothetical protein